MSGAVIGANVSQAWLAAFESLLSRGGEAINLAVTIADPGVEDVGVRQTLDAFLESRRSASRGHHGVERVSTVANTVFPQSLYRPSLGVRAREHLYELTQDTKQVSRRRNRSDTYFARLVAWERGDGEFNQLERAIVRLSGEHERGRRSGNAYELGLVRSRDEFVAGSMAVYGPGVDNRTMGFPCLSHISLSLHQGELHMTALYRNHQFVRRAYGNYLGLARLLAFTARESGWEMGELMCVSSHATAEIGSGTGFGRKALLGFAQECREAEGSSVVPASHWGSSSPAARKEKSA
jgi:hypothetical protein